MENRLTRASRLTNRRTAARPEATSRRAPVTHAVTRAAHLAFDAFLILTLATPAWREGPFTWWPVWSSPMLAGRPASIGLLSLLPVLVSVVWLGGRWLRGRSDWSWGRPGYTLPLLGLSLLDVLTLDMALTWRTVVQVTAVGLMWLVYLYLVNERPKLAVPLAVVIMAQSVVALAQFWLQRDLGLAALGELNLDATTYGMSVLWAREQPWLRAYGLTAHPNNVGAMLAVLWLLLLPAVGRASRMASRKASRLKRDLLMVVLSLGLLGLLSSFSRAAWLGWSVGLAAWLMIILRRRPMGQVAILPPARWLMVLLPSLLFLVAYHDLVGSRFFALDTPGEAESLHQRVADAQLAPQVIAARPLQGVGAGNYLTAAQPIDPQAGVVHNVFLLVAAELGLPGAVLWLWLGAAPFVVWYRERKQAQAQGEGATMQWAARLAPWLGMLVIGVFDNTLWFTTSWRGAILLALLVANLQVNLPAGDTEAS